ncbi:MAG: OmpA family protein [Akkermansiaceae bacterium]
MQEDYQWSTSSSYRSPTDEGVGKWVVIALLSALLIHIVGFFGLSRINVFLPEAIEETEIRTEVVRVNRVDLDDARPEVTPPEQPEIVEPAEIVPPADELEALENLPEMDIDINPDVEVVQIPKENPAAKGALEGELNKPMEAPNFEPDLPEMGNTEDFFPRASESQIAVDPGSRMAQEDDPDAFAETLRKGAGGESEDGFLKGFTSLDKMTNMDGNALLATKALIGSDLLFDFNSDQLRQSARVSLMKVAMLIHKHPKLVCWVDGHTDLIGGETPNLELSRRRAMAVKRWLVTSMELDEKRIAVRGFGKSNPLVKAGTVEQQAPNRRVEIKMRKHRPEGEVAYTNKPATPNKPASAARPTAPPAMVKKPKRAVPVEPARKPASRAVPVEEPAEPTQPRRAIPVDE